MQTIPLRATSAQAVSVVLGGQNCQITLRQKSTGLFVDLHKDNTEVVSGVLAQHMRRVVRERYHGFIGDITFLDTQGEEDPTEAGLGSRFVMVYIEAGENPTSQFAI